MSGKVLTFRSIDGVSIGGGPEVKWPARRLSGAYHAAASGFLGAVLWEAVRKFIFRAAQVTADEDQHIHKIKLGDLPSLSK